MAHELDALREEEEKLQARLARCVKTLKGTARAHDDIDREKSKMNMDKWFAEEDYSFASLIPGLGGADRLRQMTHLRDGTLGKFHQERAAEIKQAERPCRGQQQRIKHRCNDGKAARHTVLGPLLRPL